MRIDGENEREWIKGENEKFRKAKCEQTEEPLARTFACLRKLVED
jgi:hypothetical protein